MHFIFWSFCQIKIFIKDYLVNICIISNKYWMCRNHYLWKELIPIYLPFSTHIYLGGHLIILYLDSHQTRQNEYESVLNRWDQRINIPYQRIQSHWCQPVYFQGIYISFSTKQAMPNAKACTKCMKEYIHTY